MAKEGPALEDESSRRASLLMFGNGGTCDVAWQKVARELDPAETRLDRTSQRESERCLAHAGHVLEQQVAACDQCLDGAAHNLGLSP